MKMSCPTASASPSHRHFRAGQEESYHIAPQSQMNFRNVHGKSANCHSLALRQPSRNHRIDIAALSSACPMASLAIGPFQIAGKAIAFYTNGLGFGVIEDKGLRGDTDDWWRDYDAMRSRGVVFETEPRQESYGIVAVFGDLYGNRWDLLQLKIPPAPSLLLVSAS